MVSRFTRKDLDDLFSITNWKNYYENTLKPKVYADKRFENMKDWEKNVNKFEYIVYPLCQKQDGYYKCRLHDTVIPCDGFKYAGWNPKPVFFRNIHFSEFIAHCIQYRPQEHKAYLEKILFKEHVTTTRSSSND